MYKNSSWQVLPKIDKNCFGCGADNHHGLNMSFETNGEKVRSSLIVPEHLRGWNNIVHGGVISTIADEIMAWAAIRLLQRFILTRSITTTFLKPVFIGSTLHAYGFIENRVNDKKAIMACEILNHEDKVCAKATGDFALFTPEEFEKLDLIPKPLLEEMTAIL